jgi:hypothetical protein
MPSKPELAKMLGYLTHLSKPLSSDLSLAMEQLKVAHDRFLRRPDTLQEMCFWGKAVVSCLFAHMDALEPSQEENASSKFPTPRRKVRWGVGNLDGPL